MQKKNKIIACSLSVLAVLLVVAVLVIGQAMVKMSLLPEEHGNDIEGDRAKTEGRYPGIMAWYDSLHVSGAIKDTVIVNRDGYKLHAIYSAAAQPDSAKGTAIVVHGYTDNHIVFLNLGRMYRDSLDYNILMPDLFYHGYSEGTIVQMGWNDRLDVKQWLGVAHDIFGGDKMVVHGVSMGGATTMMLSGEPDLPAYVKGFVDDCGYTSVWDQFAYLAEVRHIPGIVLWCGNLYNKLFNGWSFKEASSVKQLAKCKLPMLFIHGDKDDFVPTKFVYENYDAKTQGEKTLWIAPGTEHAMAYKDYPEEYTKQVREFLQGLD